jgi:hypothetical protein
VLYLGAITPASASPALTNLPGHLRKRGNLSSKSWTRSQGVLRDKGIHRTEDPSGVTDRGRIYQARSSRFQPALNPYLILALKSFDWHD